MVDADKEIVKNDDTEKFIEPVQEGQESTEENAGEEIVEQEEPGEVEPGDDSSRRDEEYVKHIQNWRAIRESNRKKDEVIAREQSERIRIQRDYEELNQRLAEQERLKEADPLSSMSDDDLAEVKHVKKYKKEMEDEIRELKVQVQYAQQVAELKSKFPDFDEVVNEDTLGMLKEAEPELADSLANNPNFYTKAAGAYKAIKRCGLAKDTFNYQKQRVNENIAKPRTANSISPQHGESPLSKANAFATGLTEERKQQHWEEMQKIING